MDSEKPDLVKPATDHEILLEIWSDVKEIKDSYQTIRKELYGNGQVGYLERVRDLEGKIGGLIRTLVTIGIAFGTLVLGLLFEIFTGKVEIIFH